MRAIRACFAGALPMLIPLLLHAADVPAEKKPATSKQIPGRNVVLYDTTTEADRTLSPVNPAWWPVNVTITLKQGKFLPNDSVKTVSSSEREVVVDLPGYGVAHFPVTDDSVLSKAAAETTSDAAAEFFQSKLQLFRDTKDLQPAVLGLAMNILGSGKAGIDKNIQALQAACNDGNHLEARSILRRPEMEAWESFLRERRAWLATKGETRTADSSQSYRVNCGSLDPYEDQKGRAWERDKSLSQYAFILGTKTWGAAGGNVSTRGLLEVQNTESSGLFQSERFGMSRYLFRVPNGTYHVTLHIAETWHKGFQKGVRVYDILLNEKPFLPKFDPYAAAGAGNTAVVKTGTVDVTDNIINIRFVPVSGQPIINAIEIDPK